MRSDFYAVDTEQVPVTFRARMMATWEWFAEMSVRDPDAFARVTLDDLEILCDFAELGRPRERAAGERIRAAIAGVG